MDSTRLLLPLLPWEFDIFLVASPLQKYICSANPKTLILSYPLLSGWCSKIHAEGLLKHPLKGISGNSVRLQ